MEAAGRPERAGEREVSEDTDAANPVRRARARRACPPDGPWVHPGDSFPTSRGGLGEERGSRSGRPHPGRAWREHRAEEGELAFLGLTPRCHLTDVL